MTLSDLSIKRPVFAWMLMIGLVVFGLLCYFRLGVSQLPDYDFPVINVSVQWPGAAPEVMEAEIVDRLELSLTSVQSVREITSSIRQGQANITMEFEFSRNVDAALQEVQSKINSVKLPDEVDPPIVTKNNPDDQPIIWIGVSSTRSLHDTIVYTDLYLRDQFQILPGVGEIILGGFSERNLRIWVDNEKLKKYELTILDVKDAVTREHYEAAAGIIENNKQEMNIRTMGEGLTAEQASNILITTRGGLPIYNTTIRMKDIARVEDGLDDIRRVARMQGVMGVSLGIKKQRGENAVKVGERIRQKMDEINKTLPEDIKLGVNFDSTKFIKESIDETQFTLVLSGLITAVVCMMFLGSWNSTFNVLLSIPTSIIGTFMAIYFLGYTLNMFTILALALAIGVVVDDAIMVLENIVRHFQMGKNRVQASRDGAREITFAAVAASLAMIAIFMPVVFVDGIIGKFIAQFGITMSAAVALSLLEAITLMPMRCSQMMSEKEHESRFAKKTAEVFESVAAVYRKMLEWCLNHRWKVVLTSLALTIASFSLLPLMRKELIPPQDQSMFLIQYRAPVDTSLTRTSELIAPLEKFLREQPEVVRVFCAIGGFSGGEVNTGRLFVTMVPRNKRKMSQSQFVDYVREQGKKLTTLKLTPQDLSQRGFTAKRGYPIEFNIRGPRWDVLDKASKEIMEEMSKTGLAVDVDTDYQLGMPEVRVVPRREQAAQSGISMANIGQTVEAAIGGVDQGKFTNDGRRYDVRIRLEANERLKPEDILDLQIRTIYGELVRLGDYVDLEVKPTPQSISRNNRERSIQIYANVATGKSQAEAVSKSIEIARKHLPEGYKVVLSGNAQAMQDTGKDMFSVLLLGIVVAYMVLASQFNSFLHPWTVLVALPFSLTGAFVALYLGNHSINLYSAIGIILLMGIVKKNSILLVEFTNKLRYEEGLPIKEALLRAGPIRLRPILMTSIATLAAAIPPALALGPERKAAFPCQSQLSEEFWYPHSLPCSSYLASTALYLPWSGRNPPESMRSTPAAKRFKRLR